jgi:alginate O-acetyltransferase complex protein AlgI
VLAREVARRQGAWQKLALVAALIIDVGTLGTFKYADFVLANLRLVVPSLQVRPLGLQLPLGISFFVFQLVSYQLDVYWKRVDPEHRMSRFAAYILMFPHLIAGPIVRYADIREELARRTSSGRRLDLAAQYFIVGLCQKVLIANTVAPVADHAFSLAPPALTTGAAWLGAIGYTLQIYFDFCGYSNMAIGLAFALGFTFPRNFDYPYSARSVTEFWRRWHMSLSFWFRDYVYIPLGGSRFGRWITARNLVVVFFLTGLWHGAAWNFIVWGLFHGAFLLVERVWLGRRLALMPAVASLGYTLLVVMVGWVFFRAPNLSHAVGYLRSMFAWRHGAPGDLDLRVLLSPEVLAAFVFGVVLSVPSLPALLERLQVRRYEHTGGFEPRMDPTYVHKLPVVWLVTGFLLASALLVGSTLNPFLYFRF